ncbi:universal stress protein [Niabella beijingensis]|uniref:universal stress protein n=1 Tax=Niabella beijingensis TaxID=2872700 RepID=UPI001CBE6497|nr:universal stress protein [Niabella beijingensis]MBZ4187894.1 universal stress protein [Niabella beijingensis]
MKKILALTDFSENAQHAVQYALTLAAAWRAGLYLLHTYEPPVLFQADASGGVAPEGAPGLLNYTLMMEQSEALAEASTQKINALKEAISASHPDIAVTAQVTEGFLGDVANDLTEKAAIDLVLMGIKGKSGLEKILIGSNAIKAIEGIQAPLLIVPENADNVLPVKIALASDLELLSEGTIAALEQFFNGLPVADLLIVNVNMNPSDPVNQEKVSAIKAQLQAFNPVIHFLEAQHVETGLETFVAENGISLLVFIHHERSWVGQLFHKSVSKQIAWNTNIPVLRLKG